MAGLARSKFGDVWRDMASEYVPNSMSEAFRMCEFLYENFPTYKKGSERVVDYFLTSIKLSGGDDKKRKEFEEVLTRDTTTVSKLRQVDVNFMAYGNAVISPHFPFIRSLSCQTCKTETTFSGASSTAAFNFQTGDFTLDCRKCKKTTVHKAIDRPDKDPKKVQMVVWDPKKVHIEFNDITQEAEYWVSISEHTKRKVRDNSQFFLKTLPMPVLDCIRRNQKLKLRPEYVLHLKEPTLAGLPTRGWGSPPILGAFRNFFRLQILMRQDERLMLDYITPMRLVSPKQGSYSEGNSIMNASMSKFAANFQSAVETHRMSGIDWHVLPFPVDYQAIGGEGRSASTRDLVEDEEGRILNARGVPPEFYRASMTLQAAPVALRLFERSWSNLVNGNNKVLQWWADILTSYLEHGSYTCEMESVTIVDDLDNKMWRLQAVSGQMVSQETGFRPMGIDPSLEQDLIIEEQMTQQRKQTEAQEKLEMEQLSLVDSSQGSQGGQSGQGGVDPMESVSQADQIAGELLDPNIPQAEVNRRLRSIKQTNEALHAMVTQKMKEKRGLARSVGQDAGMQAVLSGQV